MTDQLSDTRTHHHSPDPLRNHGYNDVCSCGVRIHRDADGTWAPDNPSTDATCKTCSWWVQAVEILAQAKFYVEHDKGECRRNAPIPSPEDSSSWWPVTHAGDWCGDHPDRQPRDYAEVTPGSVIVTHDDDGPSAADMRRIVDALGQMAHCAAVKL